MPSCTSPTLLWLSTYHSSYHIWQNSQHKIGTKINVLSYAFFDTACHTTKIANNVKPLGWSVSRITHSHAQQAKHAPDSRRCVNVIVWRQLNNICDYHIQQTMTLLHLTLSSAKTCLAACRIGHSLHEGSFFFPTVQSVSKWKPQWKSKVFYLECLPTLSGYYFTYLPLHLS